MTTLLRTALSAVAAAARPADIADSIFVDTGSAAKILSAAKLSATSAQGEGWPWLVPVSVIPRGPKRSATRGAMPQPAKVPAHFLILAGRALQAAFRRPTPGADGMSNRA